MSSVISGSGSYSLRALYRLFVYVWMAVGLAWLSLLIGVLRDGFIYIAERNCTGGKNAEANNKTFTHNHPCNYDENNAVSIWVSFLISIDFPNLTRKPICFI